jgi:hypothetical protein
MENTPKDTQ